MIFLTHSVDMVCHTDEDLLKRYKHFSNGRWIRSIVQHFASSSQYCIVHLKLVEMESHVMCRYCKRKDTCIQKQNKKTNKQKPQ